MKLGRAQQHTQPIGHPPKTWKLAPPLQLLPKLLPYCITEIKNAAFRWKNGIRSEKTRNKFCFLTFQSRPTEGLTTQQVSQYYYCNWSHNLSCTITCTNPFTFLTSSDDTRQGRMDQLHTNKMSLHRTLFSQAQTTDLHFDLAEVQ